MCQQPRHVLSLCPLNLMLLPSSLSNDEGRCYSSPGQHVNLLLHTRALGMIALAALCALSHFSFVLLLLGVLHGTSRLLLRLVLVSIFLRVIFRFFLTFWIHPWIYSNQILVFGRFDCAHHHQLILVLCEGFHEPNKIRNILGSSYQFSGIEGQNKHWIVRTKLWENGQN